MKTHHCENLNGKLLGNLSEYIDGDLADELCAAIERHLESCPDCNVVVNTLRKTVELYHATAQAEPLPDDVRERLFARLDLSDYMKKTE